MRKPYVKTKVNCAEAHVEHCRAMYCRATYKRKLLYFLQSDSKISCVETKIGSHLLQSSFIDCSNKIKSNQAAPQALHSQLNTSIAVTSSVAKACKNMPAYQQIVVYIYRAAAVQGSLGLFKANLGFCLLDCTQLLRQKLKRKSSCCAGHVR